MHITFVAKGCRDKAAALREFAASAQVELREICFMGDDVNDLAAMEIAGASAAPSNASREALEHADMVTQNPGGNGAVREIVDALLAAKDLNTREVLLRP
jgi:3-deoxy-D-manno-octulosonate 8-phosphate phosphatase (KDO 8-P phosphatase)